MTTKASKKKIDKAKEERAAQGRPTSPAEDLTDHSVSASEIASQVDPAGNSGATVNANSMDAVADVTPTDDDNSLAGKIRKSELFFVRNHVTGEDYVGISPQNDKNATPAEKRLSTISALDGAAPRTGMVVKPKSGQPFTIGDGYGPDKTPADWASIVDPNTEKPLFG